MSGAAIGTAVGFVAGFFLPGGPQVWATIGGALGGYLDPTQIKGPRLSDARAQTSRDGVPIPFGYGTFPCAGNVIWQADVVEHENTDDGKGGPEVTTYTYTRSYAIGICKGPITGLLQIKRNGKLVYDARTKEALIAELMAGGWTVDEALKLVSQMKALNSSFAQNMTLYLGDETQLPDPTIEAHEGAGNVSPMRGLAYLVAADDDVTELQGAIPQFEFVVNGSGQLEDTTPPGIYWNSSDTDTVPGTELRITNGSRNIVGNGTGVAGCRGTVTTGGGLRYFEVVLLRDVNVGELRQFWCGAVRVDDSLDQDFVLTHGLGLFFDGSGDSATARTPNVVGTGPSGPGPGGIFPLGTVLGFAMDFGTGKCWLSVDGVWHISDPETDPNGLFGDTFDGGVYAPWYGATPGGTTTTVSDARLCQFGDEIQYLPDGFSPWGDAFRGVPIPDAPGWYVMPDGTVIGSVDTVDIEPLPPVLGDIVADLCGRVGVDSGALDVSQLTDLVDGYRVATEASADSLIEPLRVAYFFDAAEYDGVLHFIKRGGDSVLGLGAADLVRREGEPIEMERVQEVELLRRVTVGYLDPAAAYTPTTQKFERRAGTVSAKAEASVEVPVVMDADTAAQVAEKRVRVAWSETERFQFTLPYRLTALVPTDVVDLTDLDGRPHRVRLMDRQEDTGQLLWEGMLDRASAYTGFSSGVSPKPPTFVEPGLRGPTTLMVMDLPIWDTDENDELGVYIAGRGPLAGWAGATVQMSRDSGATWSTALTIEQASVIGYTTTDLAAWVSAEYPADLSITVYLPRAPESVSYETLLQYRNRAAIRSDSGRWQILQYQTVVDHGDNTYTLSGLVLGRYATLPEVATAGADFVLLDATVQFLRAGRAFYQQTVLLRAVSLGTSPDNAIPQSFTFDVAASQTEWPPHMVAATRDGSDNVAVSWVGRGRLGPETAPFDSQYFRGYRVFSDDGVTVTTYDTTDTAYTIASAPDPITISVAALNEITGPSAHDDEVIA